MTEENVPRLDESAEDPVLKDAIASARRDVPSDERMRALSVAFAGKLGALGAAGGGGASGAGTSGAGGTTAAGAGALKGATIVVSVVIAASAIWYTTRPAPSAEPPKSAPVPALVESAKPANVESPKSEAIPTLNVDELPKAPPVATPKASASAEVPKESDTALLGRAQKELGKNPAQALTLLNEHAKTFPRSGFGQEREVMTIDALVRLGRRDEAEARANQFATAYPKSAHNRRIDSLLGR